MPYYVQPPHPDTIARRQMWSEAGRRGEANSPRGEASNRNSMDEGDGRELGGGRPASSAASPASADAL
jgi:hypothetical protein